MTWIVLRSALAAVFAVSSGAKFADPDGTRTAVTGFGVGEKLMPAVATALPIAEAAVAILLIPGTTARIGAAGALALLLAFIVAIAVNLAHGRTPDCNCFGQIHSTPIGPSMIVRNVMLAAAAAAIAIAASGGGGSVLDDGGRAGAALVSAGVVLAVLLLLPGRRQGLVTGTPVTKTHDHSAHEEEDRGPPIGSPAPAYALEDLTGHTRTLDHFVERGKPVLLVFVTPSCGPCRRLAPVLADWQQQFPGRVTIGVLFSGAPDVVRESAEAFGISEVLIDTEKAVQNAYEVRAAPSAILIGPDGLIASRVAAGEPSIRDLLLEAFGIRGLVTSLRGEPTDEHGGDPGEALIDPETIDGSFVPVRREGVALGEHDGESVLVDRWTWGVHLLNPAAAIVWQCLDGSGSIDEIAADIADILGVPLPEAKASVLETSKGFGRQDLLAGVGLRPEEAQEESATAPH